MTSKEVDTVTEAQPPALQYEASNIELDSRDIKLPKLKLGQKMTKGEPVPFGCIFTTTGQDDPSPEVLYEAGAKEGVKFHVLGLRKGLSWQNSDNDLETTYFGDPEAPPEAWTTYTYTVMVAGDHTLPYDFLITRSGTPQAKTINLILAQQSGRGPAYEVAFEMTTKEKENKHGKWVIPQVKVVEAKKEDVEAAANLASLVAQPPAASTPQPQLDVPEL